MTRRGLAVVKQSESVDVDHAIAGMSDAHLQCRDFGHSWRPYDVTSVPQQHAYREALLCGRCKTLRLRLIDARGFQLATSYRYPDTYLVKGLGRLDETDRATLRLAALQTAIDELERKAARRGA